MTARFHRFLIARYFQTVSLAGCLGSLRTFDFRLQMARMLRSRAPCARRGCPSQALRRPASAIPRRTAAASSVDGTLKVSSTPPARAASPISAASSPTVITQFDFLRAQRLRRRCRCPLAAFCRRVRSSGRARRCGVRYPAFVASVCGSRRASNRDSRCS